MHVVHDFLPVSCFSISFSGSSARVLARPWQEARLSFATDAAMYTTEEKSEHMHHGECLSFCFLGSLRARLFSRCVELNN